MASIHRDLCGSGALLLLDWERKKAPLVPPNGMVRALGRYLTFAEASIGGGISSTSRAGTVSPLEIVTVARPASSTEYFTGSQPASTKSRRWSRKIAKDLNAEAAPDSVVVLLEVGDVGTRRTGPKPFLLKVLSRTSPLGS